MHPRHAVQHGNNYNWQRALTQHHRSVLLHRVHVVYRCAEKPRYTNSHSVICCLVVRLFDCCWLLFSVYYFVNGNFALVLAPSQTNTHTKPRTHARNSKWIGNWPGSEIVCRVGVSDRWHCILRRRWGRQEPPFSSTAAGCQHILHILCYIQCLMK